MIWSLVIGLFVGIVAKFIMPGKDGGGIIVTSILGVVGAWVAHFLGSSMGMYGPEEPVGFFAAVLGAILVLFVYRMTLAKRA
jgi:uncharacterized membrane protein YeaQ/YmgE (transglycosylase-associated protein family)